MHMYNWKQKLKEMHQISSAGLLSSESSVTYHHNGALAYVHVQFQHEKQCKSMMIF